MDIIDALSGISVGTFEKSGNKLTLTDVENIYSEELANQLEDFGMDIYIKNLNLARFTGFLPNTLRGFFGSVSATVGPKDYDIKTLEGNNFLFKGSGGRTVEPKPLFSVYKATAYKLAFDFLDVKTNILKVKSLALGCCHFNNNKVSNVNYIHASLTDIMGSKFLGIPMLILNECIFKKSLVENCKFVLLQGRQSKCNSTFRKIKSLCVEGNISGEIKCSAVEDLYVDLSLVKKNSKLTFTGSVGTLYLNDPLGIKEQNPGIFSDLNYGKEEIISRGMFLDAVNEIAITIPI